MDVQQYSNNLNVFIKKICWFFNYLMRINLFKFQILWSLLIDLQDLRIEVIVHELPNLIVQSHDLCNNFSYNFVFIFQLNWWRILIYKQNFTLNIDLQWKHWFFFYYSLELYRKKKKSKKVIFLYFGTRKKKNIKLFCYLIVIQRKEKLNFQWIYFLYPFKRK